MQTAAALSLSEGLTFSDNSIWQVQSVHDNYVNLITPGGLVALTRSGSSLIPFGIEVDMKDSWHSCRFSERQLVLQGPDSLIVEDVITITGIAKCPRYSCRPRSGQGNSHLELIRRIIRINQLCLHPKKLGGILIYLGKYDPQRYWFREGPYHGFYEERIRQRFEALVAGIYRDDDYLIVEGVCGLLGIGPGITPSRDEFLLGFLCGMRTIGYEHCKRVADKMAHYMVQNAPRLTASIATEYIKYGAKGLYHQRVNDFIEAFNTGSEGDLEARAADLMELGSFSGVDLLTGFAYGGLTALHASTLVGGRGVNYANLQHRA